MRNKFVCRALGELAAILLTMACLAASGHGQAVSGTVVGTVSDSTGASIANTEVQASNAATGITLDTKTNAAGEYRFNNLPVGAYKISASAEGFQASTRQTPVDLNATITVNFTLKPGTASTTIEITAVPPMLDTTTAQVTSTYGEIAAADVATVSTGGAGLGVLNLSLYSAGVASPGGLGAGTGPSIGGQRSRNNNFTIEGVDNNSKVVTGPLAIVPNDAVASFSLLQNQFSAEFGHSSGGQFNTVVQSGTNNFHGKVYEYFQNRNLNAIDYVVALPAEASGSVPEKPSVRQ